MNNGFRDDIDFVWGSASIEEICTQLSEECGELAAAACKVLRSFRGWTPVPLETATENMQEEYADVLNVMLVSGILKLDKDDKYVVDELIETIMKQKMHRWVKRIDERLLKEEDEKSNAGPNE